MMWTIFFHGIVLFVSSNSRPRLEATKILRTTCGHFVFFLHNCLVYVSRVHVVANMHVPCWSLSILRWWWFMQCMAVWCMSIGWMHCVAVCFMIFWFLMWGRVWGGGLIVIILRSGMVCLCTHAFGYMHELDTRPMSAIWVQINLRCCCAWCGNCGFILDMQKCTTHACAFAFSGMFRCPACVCVAFVLLYENGWCLLCFGFGFVRRLHVNPYVCTYACISSCVRLCWRACVHAFCTYACARFPTLVRMHPRARARVRAYMRVAFSCWTHMHVAYKCDTLSMLVNS